MARMVTVMERSDKKLKINFLTRDLFNIFYEEAKRIASSETEAKKITAEALRDFFKHYSRGGNLKEAQDRKAG